MPVYKMCMGRTYTIMVHIYAWAYNKTQKYTYVDHFISIRSAIMQCNCIYIYPTCLHIYTYMYICTVQDAFLAQLSSVAPHMVPQTTYITLQCPCTLHWPNYIQQIKHIPLCDWCCSNLAKSLIISTLYIIMHNN